MQTELTQAEIEDLYEQVSNLFDVTWKHADNMAQAMYAEAMNGRDKVSDKRKERAERIKSETFEQVKADSYDRVVKIKAYLDRIFPKSDTICQKPTD